MRQLIDRYLYCKDVSIGLFYFDEVFFSLSFFINETRESRFFFINGTKR